MVSTSDDYHAHIARVERTQSVLTDVPQYPNVFKAFNSWYNRKEPNQAQQQRPEKAKKKVQLVEPEKTAENPDDEQYVDKKADGFIQQKQKGFALCKWKTFKVH